MSDSFSNSAKKAAAAIAIMVASVFGVYKYYTPTGNVGIYGNKVSGWIKTHDGRVKEVAWKKKQGFNSTCDYGMSDYIVSHPDWVADFVLLCRRNGIKDVGLIFSKEKTVLNDLDYYQKIQTNDSCKFSFVVSEIEQYNTGKRAEFYVTLSVVDKWCDKNLVKFYCYQGWPNQTDVDSIVKHCDRIYLHAYGKNPTADWCYGYSKSRLNMIKNSMDKFYPNEPNKKFSHSLLLSTENPDQSKTQFSYKYFTTHSWTDPLTSLMSYIKTNSDGMKVSKRVEFGNTQIFVEDQAKIIKP